MNGSVSRREFLAVLGALLGSLPLPLRAAAAERDSLRSGLFRHRLLELEHVGNYAKLYLSQSAQESDFETLKRRLLNGASLTDVPRLKEKLIADIKSDFAAGRVVTLDGWILSVTEVRLWCLYLLSVR